MGLGGCLPATKGQLVRMPDDYERDDVPLSMRPLFGVADLLFIASQESARALRRVYREHTRKKVGRTLRPGPDTPLWNELARLAGSQVGRHYGDKAALGRILGVPRQRIHDYLVAPRSIPDAERVLELLVWLALKIEERSPDPSPGMRTLRRTRKMVRRKS